MSNISSGCGSNNFPFNTQQIPKDQNDLEYIRKKENILLLCKILAANCGTVEYSVKEFKNYYPDQCIETQFTNLRNCFEKLESSLKDMKEHMTKMEIERTSQFRNN